MTRTLICCSCLSFVDCTGTTWADAMICHVLDSNTDHPSQISVYNLDGLFDAIMRRNSPWSPSLAR